MPISLLLTEFHPLGTLSPLGSSLAQAPPASPAPVYPSANPFAQGLGAQLGTFLPSLLWAIALLVIGWLVATIAASLVGNLLKRTNIDDRIAASLLGRDPNQDIPVERWVSAAVYWIILLFAIIACLNALNLEVVSQPLNNFLQQIFAYLPRIGGALLLLALAWVIATLAKAFVTRGLAWFNLDDRLAEQTGTPPGQASPFAVNDTIANALYWFVFLLFLPLVLDALGLRGLLAPVEDLINRFLSAIPSLITAGLILLLGWIIARIVRDIVTNLLASTGVDRIGTQLGLRSTPQQGITLSKLIGTLAFVFILIPTAIAALNELNIEAISEPAVRMLESILLAIPQIFMAGVVLALAYVVGRFVADIVSDILAGMGFDSLWSALGIPEVRGPGGAQARPTLDEEGLPTTTIETPGQTPSELVGVIVLVGIILFGAVTATEILGLEQLTSIVQGVLAIAARVLSGVVVFAVGLYLANLAFRLLSNVNSPQANLLAQAARIGILIFVGAMALQQMGVAPNIVNLAFGLLMGAFAVAFAIAFGLGGRTVAEDLMRSWLSALSRR